MLGIVNHCVLEKGYGFLRVSGEHKATVFFHFRDLSPELVFDESLVGKHVQFEMTEGPKGPRAIAVQSATGV